MSVAVTSGQEPESSIIIPVYNLLPYTRECLAALEENTSSDYELIVVDNGSTDGTRDWLRSVPGATILTNEANLGFGRACNQGAAIARGKFLVFLNNDTLPQRNWLEAMVALMRSDPQIAIVGSKLVYPDNGRIQHAGVAFDGLKSPYHLYQHVPAASPLANQVRGFKAVTGACLMIRREVFLTVGGFDEAYRNGYEDVDLCLKVCRLGGKVMYCPASVVLHYESVSATRLSAEAENRAYFFQRWADELEQDDRDYLAADAHALSAALWTVLSRWVSAHKDWLGLKRYLLSPIKQWLLRGWRGRSKKGHESRPCPRFPEPVRRG